MAVYELAEPTKRRVENALLSVGVATFLAWVALVLVLPEDLVASVPRWLAVFGATAAFTPVGYMLTRRVRSSEGVALEDGARVLALLALGVGVAVLAYVALALGGVLAPW
jgi:hypothetical protein